jgi:hypothetical protein
VDIAGLEPATFPLKVGCSTNLAIYPLKKKGQNAKKDIELSDEKLNFTA